MAVVAAVLVQPALLLALQGLTLPLPGAPPPSPLKPALPGSSPGNESRTLQSSN